MFNSTATHTPSTTGTRIDDPFRLRFGSTHRLPRGLREEAAGMSWSLFIATYAPAADIRITGLETTPGRGGRNTYTAELTHLSKTEPPFTESREISAMGVASACTHLLADAGRHVEILAFHQFPIFEATVTFVRLAHQTHDSRTGWAMGFGGTPEASIAAALSSGAQRIHG
ncbi:acetyl-CoA acetyltransferase [Corynebacterium suedekumii]|uniref:Acetyl-CoA acetyltransferase n=1 Tax=Corynebacterium suedekumii TaxID=3049801 RepID=A0ABY8VNW4_9CORY|nr:acetyl-CoA acetyltransferase [Corynebacterium suedekumii]WIM70701.1 acetyl-CoA acetyltransferase [Corynebacterium suedekumii]